MLIEQYDDDMSRRRARSRDSPRYNELLDDRSTVLYSVLYYVLG